MQVKIQRAITALTQGLQSEVDDLFLHIQGRILDRTSFEYLIGENPAHQLEFYSPLRGHVTVLALARELAGDASRGSPASLVRLGDASPAQTALFSKLQGASPASAGAFARSGDTSPAVPASFSRLGGASPGTGDALTTAEKASPKGIGNTTSDRNRTTAPFSIVTFPSRPNFRLCAFSIGTL